MAGHNVNLGIGNAAESGITGMFYHAPAGTALPDVGATLPTAWKEVGAISQDGITFNTNRTFNQLKNWANKIARLLPAEEAGTVGAPVIDTTEESLMTVFGAENVNVEESGTGATAKKVITVDVTPDSMPEPEAYLFIMKDDDDMITVGTTKGYITELGEVAFQPNAAITWNATISADKWTISKSGPAET